MITKIFSNMKSYSFFYLLLVGTNIFYIFLAWLAYPETFHVLVGLMLAFSTGTIVLAFYILIKKERRIKEHFEDFIQDANERKEEILCNASPYNLTPYIRKIGSLIRSYENKLNEKEIELFDYENFIESWVHEIKKPLSLMTLLLDNRKDEMSQLVRRRMVYIRDEMNGHVGRILYYARLGTVHKDYIFENINLHTLCKETIKEHESILEETNYQVEFTGVEKEVFTDRKSLTFMIEQVIANSTKHVDEKNSNRRLTFHIDSIEPEGKTVLKISDNGPGVSKEDLPFIFDKGFTGRRGSLIKDSTGIGLYLVKRLATDLKIDIDVESREGDGFSIMLIFEKVNRK